MKTSATRPTQVTVDILCDICNASVVPAAQLQGGADLSSFTAFGQLKAEYGYGSTRDGEKVNVDLCEACFNELLMKVAELKQLHNKTT